MGEPAVARSPYSGSCLLIVGLLRSGISLHCNDRV